MTHKVIASVCSAVVLCGMAVMLCGAGPSPVVGGKAPDFSLKGSDGKTHTLKSLTAKGDVVFYFIGSTCPVNAMAVKYYNAVSAAYQTKSRIVGVIDGDQATYAEWQKRFKAPFLVLLDEKMKVIQGFKAERSPWVIHVDSQGTIGKIWQGYSKNYLEELNTLMSSITKSPAKSLDLKGAPANATYG